MRSLTIAFLTAILAPLFVVGCNGDNVVTDQHIQMATEKCQVNGGLSQVDSAQATRMYENCGYRSSRKTDMYEYRATFACKNGAKFDLTWSK